MAAVFNEWARRYHDQPAPFNPLVPGVVVPSYGDDCVRFYRKLEAKLRKQLTVPEVYDTDDYELEKLAEYQAAVTCADSVDAVELHRALRRLLEQAERNDADFSLPCVPITQIDDIDMPLAVRMPAAYPGTCEIRGTPERPEPAHLFDDDDSALLKQGIPALWFRFDTTGRPFRRWSKSNLQFPEWDD